MDRSDEPSSMNRVTESVPRMGKEPTYISRRAIKANGRGWGKYHIIQAGEKVALCSYKLQHHVSDGVGRGIEAELRFLEFRIKRRRSKGHQACKLCLQRAEKLRNPLDRLASI